MWNDRYRIAHVSPAHAGIDQAVRKHGAASVRFPRTRGDRPDPLLGELARHMFPPHTRG